MLKKSLKERACTGAAALHGGHSVTGSGRGGNATDDLTDAPDGAGTGLHPSTISLPGCGSPSPVFSISMLSPVIMFMAAEQVMGVPYGLQLMVTLSLLCFSPR